MTICLFVADFDLLPQFFRLTSSLGSQFLAREMLFADSQVVPDDEMLDLWSAGIPW